MKFKEAAERAMARRGITKWHQLALRARVRPASLYLVRDGREDTAEFGTIKAVVEAVDMTFAEFFADAPGWADVTAMALMGLSESDRMLLSGILGRMAVMRTRDEVERLAALSHALSGPGDNDPGMNTSGR